MATISEIQDYLMKNHRPELDEQVQSKSEYRVTREQAKSIKQNKELPKGQCNLCSRTEDRLVPITMRICATCAGRFMKRGKELEVLQKIPGDYACDNCFTRTFTTLYVNPKICKLCANKIGHAHKYRKEDLIETQRKMEQTKKEITEKRT